MAHYAASTVPIMKEATVLRFEEGGKPRSAEMEAFQLISSLTPKDHLWLMMGSTNAAVALGAYRHGAQVHQLSYARATSSISLQSEPSEPQNSRTKISPEHVYELATSNPGIFYSMYPRQGEVLELINAWQMLSDAMEARKAYANLMRTRMQQQAIVSGKVLGTSVSTTEELAALIEEHIGVKDPRDAHMRVFREREAEALKALEKTSRSSGLYENVFGKIDGVGPRLAARFITGIERIERFETADHLMRYAGMMPTRNGKLPSKKQGGLVSRSPGLNNACFMLQEQMFKYGAHTAFGHMIHGHIVEVCPCTPEMRKEDKDLRAKHSGAVKAGRVLMTRAFLHQVYQDWRAYVAQG